MEESKKSVQIMTKEVREQEVLKISPKRELTKSLIWVSFASSILSVHYGYFIWIVYSPGVLLQKFFNTTSFEQSSRKYEVLELAINIAIIPLGGIFASVMAGFLADILGRKCSLVIANITAMTSAILMSGQRIINSLEFTFLSHLFTGLSSGFILSFVPLYVGEIAPRNYRGAMIFIHQFCLNIGILLSQIFAVKEFLGNVSGWSVLMGLAGILPLIQLFLLPCIPETPRYLMIYKKNERQARKVLQMLRETDDVEDEMEELYQEDLAEGNNKNMTPLKLIRTQSMQLQIITIVVITAGSQLNGISLMQIKNYSCAIFWPFSIGTLIYIYKMVPETTKQTFPEIKRVMSMKTAKRFHSRESRRKLNLRRHV
ncbi:solute carrier family 2, facilitated glucose transporter member 5-like [Pantherophis guttatus]|uniref:Solute carrier family 2, facilitated glucose transporter member 5-like n=1 Tax=Pantherophis guttatus TaxID=94885 RepID=A0A6P9DHE4_PANGU|nr:solute carrier family 2, facilitated glucose transporter member 5-like [Pantherophis guttatus]